ncbi:MAG: pyridoxamine 5'-phosphate oxidase [Cyclobacteriaceae bacterium]|jgi:pyridoxamine 5'-phosphate oxidase|nr:pyridoxamine 5'-phosphate oxidase [Cyclobacteriaceae bacterium]
MALADIRKEYAKARLDEQSIDPHPLVQFQRWMDEALAAQLPEPTAMNLATVTPDGRPSARTVLLKGVAQGQFQFYTNYQSQKGVELESNPACALTFFWPELERQVRIEGIAQRLDAAVSEAYFQSRPRGSQVGAWASPQSAVIEHRELLEKRVAEIEKRFAANTHLPKPHQWGGYGVTPHEIEFWQGRPSRLHDRLVYYWVDSEWKIKRLAP